MCSLAGASAASPGAVSGGVPDLIAEKSIPDASHLSR